jgi:hypothetical protein
MPANFDWHAEEESNRTEPIYVSPENPDGPGKRQRWLLLVAAVVVVLAAGVLAWRQLRSHADDTAAAIETDVLASHELVTTAVTAVDPELLVGLLSGRNPEWTATQLALLRQGLLFDRPSLNLTWQPPLGQSPPGQSPAISVTLAADLQSAELVVRHPYRLFGGDETVVLQQTLIYRQGADRWLLSPPDDAFWGETIVAAGRYISLSFPARDQELGRRLAADIESLVGSACSTLLLSCPENLRLEITLTTDPAVWLAESGPEAALQGRRELVLPAPTLAGRPADVAGYRALYWSYGSRVLTALVTDLVGYSCCQHALFYQALLDKQLQQLGLRSWPVSTDDYRQALARQVTLAELEPLWRQNGLAGPVGLDRPEANAADPDWWLAYAVVDFLFQDPNNRQPVVEMQRRLMGADSLHEWARDLASAGTSVDRAWLRYLQQQVVAGQSSPPISLPDQDIVLMCSDGTRGTANLYRLDLANGQWVLEIGDRNFVVMMPLPDGRGLMLVEQFLINDQLLSLVWQAGQETAISQGETFYIPAGRLDPTGHYLPVIVIRPSSTAFGLLNLETCQPEDCPVLPLPGLPVWSPDGQHTLFAVDGRIALGDSRGQFVEHIGPGDEPAWLDNSTYGYLLIQEAPVLLARKISESGPDARPSGAPEVLIDPAALEAALSTVLTDTASLAGYQITHATSSYRNPGQLFLIAAPFPGQEQRPVLIRYAYPIGETAASLIAGFGADATTVGAVGRELFNLEPETFSPDGRWLILSANGPPASSFNPMTHVAYDTATGRSQLLAGRGASGILDLLGSNSWSSDSQWLLNLVDGAIIATAPSAGYQHVLTYPFTDCTMAAWIAPLRSDLAGRPTAEVDGTSKLYK